MDAAAVELVGVPYVLNVIGFTLPAERENIMTAGLAAFPDFRFIEEKDIRDMSEEFGKRNMAAGRIVFDIGRIKRMIGAMHWIQDCYRARDVPRHEDFNEETLLKALSLAKVRKTDIDLVDTNAKAVSPGKFKDERKWPEWERAFENYLSVIPGVNGVPLSYVIRAEASPIAGMIYETHNERLINRAPLIGNYFVADTRRIHTLLAGFIHGGERELDPQYCKVPRWAS